MDRFTTDMELQHVLAALWGYYGLPPAQLSGFYYANATGGYLQNGSYTIRGRSQALSNALAEVIEERGGKILYNTPVERVTVRNGRVTGVVTAGGETLPARTVVSNASARTLMTRMIDREHLPAGSVETIEALSPSISSFIVWLGLNRDLRGKVEGFSTHVASGRGPEEDYRSFIKGKVDTGPFSVSLYDNLYEGYSTPGTSSVMLLFLCGYAPWQRFEKAYLAGDKTAYLQEKNRWRDILIRRAEERVIPRLSSMIEVAEAATPLTNLRYTGNPGGAIYGFEQSMDNAYMNRIDNRLPVEGLYLAGAWGSPGGGYSGAIIGGQDAFGKILQDWGA